MINHTIAYLILFSVMSDHMLTIQIQYIEKRHLSAFDRKAFQHGVSINLLLPGSLRTYCNR